MAAPNPIAPDFYSLEDRKTIFACARLEVQVSKAKFDVKSLKAFVKSEETRQDRMIGQLKIMRKNRQNILQKVSHREIAWRKRVSAQNVLENFMPNRLLDMDPEDTFLPIVDVEGGAGGAAGANGAGGANNAGGVESVGKAKPKAAASPAKKRRVP